MPDPIADPTVGVALRDAADALDRVAEALRTASASPSVSSAQPGETLAFLSVAGACQSLGLSRATINRRIADGTLRSRRVGGRRLIPLAAVRELTAAEA